MSSQHSQEVQLLLTAEKRASEKVAAARTRKARRLKQAKEEAAADIELFRKERHAAFEKYEQEHVGSRGGVTKKIEEETSHKIMDMEKRIQEAKKDILERFIEEVVHNVEPKLYRNKNELPGQA